MEQVNKKISGLAIFAFVSTVVAWFVGLFTAEYFSLGYRMSCALPSNLAGAGALLGILSLFFIWKKRYRGKWFAILAIVFGILGLITLVC